MDKLEPHCDPLPTLLRIAVSGPLYEYQNIADLSMCPVALVINLELERQVDDTLHAGFIKVGTHVIRCCWGTDSPVGDPIF